MGDSYFLLVALCCAFERMAIWLMKPLCLQSINTEGRLWRVFGLCHLQR